MALVVKALEGAIASLVLNRPEARNALSIEMCDAIVDALGEIDVMDAVRVVLVRGEGSVFCSGADFAAVSGPSGIEFVAAFERMLDAIARHRLPIIASIHGAALGGGLQLATACDFRITAGDARLGIPSARLGILVNFENVRRLTLLVGLARAKEILMTARVYSGAEAVATGLVNRSVPARDLAAETESWAREIAALSPLSVQGSKRALQVLFDDMSNPRNRAPGPSSEMDELVAQAYASDDLQEGVRAMQERRPPDFTGR
ncbi:MAG TPA: enoyl-CoA hydratase-related protein [Actinomycetota bacterium]|jgi:enoyl-CoA hydratase